MTTPEQRMTVDEPVELLIRPVAAGEQPDPEDQDPDNEEEGP